MSNPPDNTNLNDYYNNSPDVIIRDFKGRLYYFPLSKYNGGSVADESQAMNWYNGKKWGGFVWNDVYEISSENYVNGLENNSIRIRNDEKDNCVDNDDLPTLNNQGSLPGYDKKSGGTYKNDKVANRNGSTYGYVIADRGASRKNWAFSVYTKKNLDGFFNDLVALNKSVFLKLASKSCSDKTLRFEWGICNSVCTNNDTDYKRSRSVDDTNNCISGAKEWCRDDSTRIGARYTDNVDPSTHEQCRGFLSAGDFDDKIGPWCENTDKITTKWCADIRQNKGSSNMKTRLNKYLFNNYCNTDDKISKDECSDVRRICNDTKQLTSDNDPYNCNKLVKNLSNDTNIIAITNKLDLRNVPVGTNKSDLLNSFNEASTDAVEDALCALINNISDPVCKTWNGIRSSEKKLQTIRDAIDESIKKGGGLTQEVIDYITKDYIALQKFRGIDRYPNSNIIKTDLMSFCELSDYTLSTNLCKNIYNNTPYKDDQVIKKSLERINDYAFCIATNAFMGKSTKPNDPYNRICIARRDDPETFARYLPLAIRYCGTDNNIITPECAKYYNDAPANINNLIRINYLNGKASFNNKETFENIYENAIEENIDCPYKYLLIILICFILVLTCIKRIKVKHNYKIIDTLYFK